MKELHIITPVKNSINTTLKTIDAVLSSKISIPHRYTVYNDFSSQENTLILNQKFKQEGSFELINLRDITNHPSPNYDLVLQMAQEDALKADAGILIVESDVLMESDTIQRLVDETAALHDCALAACVTVDEDGNINYPYEYAKDYEKGVIDCKQVFSFSFTILTPLILSAIDFHTLDPKHDWYDAVLTKQSLKLGFKNYLFTNLPVIHRPHSSRPWRTIKEQNPLKYYWMKYTGGFKKMKQ